MHRRRGLGHLAAVVDKAEGVRWQHASSQHRAPLGVRGRVEEDPAVVRGNPDLGEEVVCGGQEGMVGGGQDVEGGGEQVMAGGQDMEGGGQDVVGGGQEVVGGGQQVLDGGQQEMVSVW